MKTTRFCDTRDRSVSPEAAESAAKDAKDGHSSNKLMPFSDLKPRVNKYVIESGNTSGMNLIENKLYPITPKFFFFFAVSQLVSRPYNKPRGLCGR